MKRYFHFRLGRLGVLVFPTYSPTPRKWGAESVPFARTPPPHNHIVGGWWAYRLPWLSVHWFYKGDEKP